LRRSRTAARAWTVWAGALGSAAAVAIPYAGLGWPDIGWAGSAGGAITFAVLRWRDHLAVRAAPIPPPLPHRPPAQRIARRLTPIVGPALSAIAERPRRVAVRRSSAAAPAVDRLNYATRTLPKLLDKLGPSAGDTAREAAGAHAALRQLAARVSVVEKTLAVAPAESRNALLEVRSSLVDQLNYGVEAYEQLGGAAAECVAALARGGDSLAVRRLTEATDVLRGLAQGLTEVKDHNDRFGPSPHRTGPR
jgi:hypothetical protein